MLGDSFHTQISEAKIPVGISQCLLGDKVRHDGSHKHDRFLTGVLGENFDYKAFCPEMAAGLGVPRETIRLLMPDKTQPENIRVVATKDASRDYTEALIARSEPVAEQAFNHLCGYILMKGSPSCGMERVKVYNSDDHVQHHRGVGVFAQKLMASHPWLPVEENGRLHDPVLRENFVTRVFALHDFKQRLGAAQKFSEVIDFYSGYKYMVMAHSVASYKIIGRYLAQSAKKPLPQVIKEFGDLFFQALAQKPTRKTHTNVLMHIKGYLKKHLNPSEKAELGELIEFYRKGTVPLSVPLMLLRHLSVSWATDYLKNQRYWQPFPDQLALRNHSQ